MRLHRVFGSALIGAALLLSTTAQPAVAAPSVKSGELTDKAAAVAQKHLGKKLTYGAAAVSGTRTDDDDPTGMTYPYNIDKTSLSFDTNRITVKIDTKANPALSMNVLAAVDFSFNRSDQLDGYIVAGKENGVVIAQSVNKYGVFCDASANVVGKTITLSVDSGCMGKPGAVAYTTMYGDFDAYFFDETQADFSPYGSLTPVTAEDGGYWLLGADGGVFAFGDAEFYGSTGNMKLNKPVVAMSPSPNSKGYRFVASDGGIFSYGNAGFYGSMGGSRLNKPVVGMATTASGNGYWLVASDGGIFAFGDAKFWGSTGSMKLNRPIVGMAPTSTGKGYWLVASDGGIFSFGDAAFYGSAGGERLERPITSMAATPNGGGYYLLSADGGLFSYGNAGFHGSSVHQALGSTNTISAMNDGYVIADAVGGVFAYGNTFHFGDLMNLGLELNSPIVGMAMAK